MTLAEMIMSFLRTSDSCSDNMLNFATASHWQGHARMLHSLRRLDLLPNLPNAIKTPPILPLFLSHLIIHTVLNHQALHWLLPSLLLRYAVSVLLEPSILAEKTLHNRVPFNFLLRLLLSQPHYKHETIFGLLFIRACRICTGLCRC